MGNIILFESKKVRRIWNEKDQKWYFSIQDVIEILTGSADIKQYVKKLKSRDPELKVNWGTICTPVEMPAASWKKRAAKGFPLKKIIKNCRKLNANQSDTKKMNNDRMPPEIEK